MVQAPNKTAFVMLAATAMLSSTATAARADETDKLDTLLSMNIEQLINTPISSSGFFKMDAEMTPGTQYVFNIEDEKRYAPVRTLADILDNSAVGINMSRHEQDSALIGVRGMMIDNNAKTPVMLDGQLLSQRVHFGYSAGLESPLLGDLQSAEVSLSPNAVVMGGGAINGYINLIPKNGKDNPGGFASYEYGMKDFSHVGETGYGYSYGTHRNVYVYAGMVAARGYKPDTAWGETLIVPGTTNGLPMNIGLGRVGGYGEPGFRVATYWNHDDFKLNVFIDKIAPQTASPSRHDYFDHLMTGISPQYTYHINDKNSLQFIAAAEVQDYSFKDYNTFTVAPTYANDGGSETHLEGKTIYRTTSFDGHAIALGTSLGRRMFFDQKNLLGNDPTGSDESLNFSWKDGSAFGEDVMSLTKKLQLTLGLRYDVVHYGTYNGTPFDEEDHVSPKAALAYKINDTSTVKGSYEHGFRYPDAVYHTWQPYWDNIVPGAGMNLHSETVDSYEVDLHKDFKEQKVTADIGAYYNEYTDALMWNDMSDGNGDGYVPNAIAAQVVSSLGWFGQFVNANKAFTTTGGELRLGWQPTDTLDLHFGYTYAQILEAPSLEQYRFPKHLIKASVRKYFLDKKLALDVNGTFTSSFDTAHLGYNPVFEDPRVILDAALSYDITTAVSVKLMGENLLKENVPSVSNQPNVLQKGVLGEDARTFYLQTVVRF